MSITTRSTKALLKIAYSTVKKKLDCYSHSRSPKKFTQAQLFSCLVLKTFLRLDYRSAAAFFEYFGEARAEIELEEVPHFTTLQKTCQRLLLQRDDVVDLLDSTPEQF